MLMAAMECVISMEERFSQLEKGSYDEVEEIEKIANMKGLPSQIILRAVRLCTIKKIRSSLARRLVCLLIPHDHISEEAVICALMRICSGICPLGIQNLLLKWITTRYDAIYPKLEIYSLMGMMCNLLDNDVLHDSVSRLLFLMFQQADFHNVTQLLECQKKIFRSRRQHLFQPLAKLKAQMSSLQWSEKNSSDKESSMRIMRSKGSCYASIFKNVRPSVADVGQHLEQGTLLMQKKHLLATMPVALIKPHLQLWIHQHLLSMYVESTSDNKDSSELLNAIFVIKDLLHAASDILFPFALNFICMWNGFDYRGTFLKLIVNLPIIPFKALQDGILHPLQNIFIFSDISFKCATVDSLADFTCQYIAKTMVKDKRTLKCREDNLDIISNLINFVEDMTLQNMLMHPNNAILLHAILDFWESVNNELHRSKCGDVAFTPHSCFVYKALLSFNGDCLNSLYRLMNSGGPARSLKLLTICKSLTAFAAVLGEGRRPDLIPLFSPDKHPAVALTVTQCSEHSLLKTHLISEGLGGTVKLLQSLSRPESE